MMFYVFLCCAVCLCTGHFVMVRLNLTYLQCLQHSFFEHLFNLYYHMSVTFIRDVDMGVLTVVCFFTPVRSNFTQATRRGTNLQTNMPT